MGVCLRVFITQRFMVGLLLDFWRGLINPPLDDFGGFGATDVKATQPFVAYDALLVYQKTIGDGLETV